MTFKTYWKDYARFEQEVIEYSELELKFKSFAGKLLKDFYILNEVKYHIDDIVRNKIDEYFKK